MQVECLVGEHHLAAERAPRADGGGQQSCSALLVLPAVAALRRRHRASVAAAARAALARRRRTAPSAGPKPHPYSRPCRLERQGSCDGCSGLSTSIGAARSCPTPVRSCWRSGGSRPGWCRAGSDTRSSPWVSSASVSPVGHSSLAFASGGTNNRASAANTPTRRSRALADGQVTQSLAGECPGWRTNRACRACGSCPPPTLGTVQASGHDLTGSSHPV